MREFFDTDEPEVDHSDVTVCIRTDFSDDLSERSRSDRAT